MISGTPTTGNRDEITSTRIIGLGLAAVFVGMLLLNAICFWHWFARARTTFDQLLRSLTTSVTCG